MKLNDNIEQLFKDKFEHFESPVNPKIWTNVRNGINASEVLTSSATKLTVGKIIASVVIGGLTIAGSIWYFSSTDSTPSTPNTQKQIEVLSKNNFENSETKIPEPLNTVETPKQESSVSISNPTTKNNVQQPKIISETAANNASKNNSSFENNSVPSVSYPAEQDNSDKSSNGSNLLSVTQIQSAQDSKAKDVFSSDQNEKQAPSAVIHATVESGDAPLTVNFSNQGFFTSNNWDFGDGTSSGSISPSHTFEKPGIYNVKLTAKNSAGSASDQVAIEVKSISGITNIPNVFSPNGDGKNDIFFFELKNITSIGVAIYSSGGRGEIHSWNTLEGNWNGKLPNGDNAPEGVYLYSIQAIGTDGVTYSKKGFVTLSR